MLLAPLGNLVPPSSHLLPHCLHSLFGLMDWPQWLHLVRSLPLSWMGMAHCIYAVSTCQGSDAVLVDVARSPYPHWGLVGLGHLSKKKVSKTGGACLHELVVDCGPFPPLQCRASPGPQ